MAKPSLLGEPTRPIRKRVSSGKLNKVTVFAKKQHGSDGYLLWAEKTHSAGAQRLCSTLM
jgi:hypothetical protein